MSATNEVTILIPTYMAEEFIDRTMLFAAEIDITVP